LAKTPLILLETTNKGGYIRPPRDSSEYSNPETEEARKWSARQSVSASLPSMGADALIDTGAILAILEKSDRWHESCLATIKQLRLPLFTAEAVLAELFHMVGESPSKSEPTWQFVRSGGLPVAPVQQAELQHVHALMSRYSDRPMEFAVATLVYVATRESIGR
jgi:uncharacterized protein